MGSVKIVISLPKDEMISARVSKVKGKLSKILRESLEISMLWYDWEIRMH